MPNLKNINPPIKSHKIRHRGSKKCKKLSNGIEEVDDQHSMLNIDLQNAIEERNNQKVEELLTQAKADKELKRAFSCDATTGENILHIASRDGTPHILKTLLDAAKSINDNNKTLIDLLLYKDSSNANTLHISAAWDNDVITSEILSYAQSVNDQNKTLKRLILSSNESGKTPLHIGALYGHIQVITKLLDAAEIVGKKHTLTKLLLKPDHNHENALYMASRNGYVEVATKLLDVAESVSTDTARKLILATNNLNENVLHIAAESNKYNGDVLVTKLLNVASNLSVNEYQHKHNVLQKFLVTYNKLGKSSVDVAAHNKNEKIIIALLDAIKNMQGSNNILQELLFHINNFHETPLYISISNENPNIFSTILDTVKNIDDAAFRNLLLFRAGQYDSVLHTLVFQKKIILVEYLLHTIKELAEVKNQNYIEELSIHTELMQEINTSYENVKCNDEVTLNQIIKCFDENRFDLADGSIRNAELHRIKYLSAEKCIREVGCFSITDFIHDYKCAKAIESLEDKNNMLIRVLLYPDRLGYNILHSAVSSRYYEVIPKLLDEAKYIDSWKYNFTKQYTDDNKCIDVVTKNHGQISVEDLLKEIKSNTMFKKYLFFTTLSVEKDNVLHIAVRVKDNKIVNKLLKDAQNVEDNNATLEMLLMSTNELGDTALHIAAQVHETKIVRQLIRYARSVEDNNTTLQKLLMSTNELGDTALHVAAQTHSTQIVQQLIRYAQNIEDNNITLYKLLTSSNKLGETALCKAYTETSQYSDTLVLLTTAAEGVNIVKQRQLKDYCIPNNDKLKNHEYNIDNNIRINRDIEHQKKGIAHHYDNGNTQVSISTMSSKSISDITAATNQIPNLNMVGMPLLFRCLYYLFFNRSADTKLDTEYTSPDTQHKSELDNLDSNVQLLLGDAVERYN